MDATDVVQALEKITVALEVIRATMSNDEDEDDSEDEVPLSDDDAPSAGSPVGAPRYPIAKSGGSVHRHPRPLAHSFGPENVEHASRRGRCWKCGDPYGVKELVLRHEPSPACVGEHTNHLRHLKCESRRYYASGLHPRGKWIFHFKTCDWVRDLNTYEMEEFRSTDEARSSGYRPCKVCKPHC